MEYKVYNLIRKYKIPFFLRVPIMMILVILGFISLFLPLPLSIPFGFFLIIIGFIFVISAKDLKYAKKIRKGGLFFAKNIVNKNTRNHKIKDIKKHIKQILNNNK